MDKRLIIMTVDDFRKLGPLERPWAVGKISHFRGKFILEPESGLYFADGTCESERRLISRTFQNLPEALQDLCLHYELTVSTAPCWTSNGNSSTFYSDFRQPTRKRISPHIEMGAPSLSTRMVLPHLAHECAHLWWRHLPLQSQQAYSDYLRERASETQEVTDYVQSFLMDWLRSRCGSSDAHCRACLRQWIEESFCETVAVIIAPDYPAFRHDTTVNLSERRAEIKQLTGLSLPIARE